MSEGIGWGGVWPAAVPCGSVVPGGLKGRGARGATEGSATVGRTVSEANREARSRLCSRLSGRYSRERSDREYPAQRPRAGRGLSILVVGCSCSLSDRAGRGLSSLGVTCSCSHSERADRESSIRRSRGNRFSKVLIEYSIKHYPDKKHNSLRSCELAPVMEAPDGDAGADERGGGEVDDQL